MTFSKSKFNKETSRTLWRLNSTFAYIKWNLTFHFSNQKNFKKYVDFKDRNRVISISNQRKRRVSGKPKGRSEKNMKKFVDKVNK